MGCILALENDSDNGTIYSEGRFVPPFKVFTATKDIKDSEATSLPWQSTRRFVQIFDKEVRGRVILSPGTDYIPNEPEYIF